MKPIRFFSIFAVIALLIACTKEEPVLNVSPSSITYTAAGGSQTIMVTSNGSWTVQSDSPWVTVSPSSGAENGTVSVTAAENTGFDARTATITVVSGSLASTVSVSQTGTDRVLKISNGNVTVPEDGGNYTVDLEYNVDYEVTIDAAASDWLAFVATKASQSKKLEFSVKANRTTSQRVGKVYIDDKGKKAVSQIITFTQDPFVGIINISDTKVEVPEDGGSYVLDIEYNVDYKVTVEGSSADWIKLVGTKATSTGKIEFFVEPNRSPSIREGKVIVSDPSGAASDKTITFTQAAFVGIINISDTKVEVPESGGSYVFDIEYNVNYKVEIESSAKDWIKFIDTKSSTVFGKLHFSVEPNNKPSTRTGKVTISDPSGAASDKTITFTQDPFVGIINISDTKVEVPEDGGSYVIDIEYNVDYKVTVEDSSADWIKLVGTKATSTGKIEFFVEPNRTPSIREGKVIVSDPSGAASDKTITFTQAACDLDRKALVRIYKEMGGSASWDNWCTDAPLKDWLGVVVEDGRVVELREPYLSPRFAGPLSDAIAELDALRVLNLSCSYEVTGTLPESFAKLVNLEEFILQDSKMVGPIPDIFGDMKKLKKVVISYNKSLDGQLPASLGKSPELELLDVRFNAFTGSIPAEWCETDKLIYAEGNRLTGQLPDRFFTMKSFVESFWKTVAQGVAPDDYSLDLGNAPYVPKEPDHNEYVDYDGSRYVIDELVKKNEYTIVAHWGINNPYGESFMSQLKSLYEKYHDKGLEIVALDTWDDKNEVTESAVRDFIKKHGFDVFKNVNCFKSPAGVYPLENPAAEVYDKNGHIIYSYSSFMVKDDIFDHRANIDLARTMRTLYGDFDPKHVSTDFSKDGEVATLQKATKGNGINIVVMGDAFVDTDMAAGGVYETLMKQAMEAFFDIEPYKSYRDRFNVYSVKAVSKNCMIGDGYDTALKVKYLAGTSVWGSFDNCMDYALKVPSIETKDNLVVIVMINSDTGGATTSSSFGYNSAVCFVTAYGNAPSLFAPIVRHEAAGHGFAHLADEYVDYSYAIPEREIEIARKQAEEKGWWANVDFTSDPSKIKWSHLLNDSRYKDSVGIIEGGFTYGHGVWRPTADSMMNTNQEYFNAPSREAIFKRIMELSGEGYSFEKFAEYDAINRK